VNHALGIGGECELSEDRVCASAEPLAPPARPTLTRRVVRRRAAAGPEHRHPQQPPPTRAAGARRAENRPLHTGADAPAPAAAGAGAGAA
jgi:hypothetical protein